MAAVNVRRQYGAGMKLIVSLGVCILGTLSLFGCSLIPAENGTTVSYILLPEQNSPSLDRASGQGDLISCRGLDKHGPVILIAPTNAPSYVGGTRIPFVNQGKVGFYQYAVWVEPISERLNLLIQQKLECGGAVSSASRVSDWVRSDYILKTELQRLEHDTRLPPGFLSLHLRAELIESSSGRSIRAKDIKVSESVNTYDAEGAVDATNRAVSKALDDLLNWIKETAAS